MKKKILIVSSSYPLFAGDINGAFVHELNKGLYDNFEVYLLAPYKKGFNKNEIIDGIHVFRHRQFIWNIDLAYGVGIYEKLKKNPLLYFVLPFFFLFQFLSVRKICKTQSIKIIHAHWLIPNAFIAVLWKFFDREIKILATIHGSDFWGLNNSIGVFLKKFTLKRINALAVVSQPLKKSVANFGYEKEIFVAPMGIDSEKFTPEKKNIELRKRFDAPGILLLYVGILVEAKGIKNLIEAMGRIVPQIPDIRLLIIGDGVLRDELENRVQKKALSKNIFFLGSIPNNDLPSYFATADFFVLPSLSEGWPVVVMEAMSAGCVPVVTNLPIFNEFSDKDLLFIAEKGNTLSLTNTISAAITSTNLNNLKRNLRSYAIINFDWKVIADNYKSIYKRLSDN